MRKFLMLGGTIVLLLCIAPASNASMVLYLDDWATTGIDRIIVDNSDSGVATEIGNSNTADGSNVVGVINFNDMIGAWSVDVTGKSKPEIGDYGSLAAMDLSSVSVSGGTGTMQIGLTNTDFFLGSAGMDISGLLKNEWEGTTDGTVTAFGVLDSGNDEFGTGSDTSRYFWTAGQGPLGPGAFSDTVTKAFSVDGGEYFSMSEYVTIHHTAAGSTSFDKSLTAIPEPAFMPLLCFGLIGLAAFRRKFKK